MKVLVTGGAGYKGIVLTKKLLDLGYQVTVLDNFFYGFEPILHLIKYPNLSVIHQDIRNDIPGLNKFDAIFHLAGISGFPACSANPASAQLVNIDATRTICEKLDPAQVLIYASTTSFYGKNGDFCNEETPVDPVSVYGHTKYKAEQIVMERENSIALRFATVFGVSPKMRIDLMVNDFTYKAIKERIVVLFDSYAKRTFIHVEDAADCYIHALQNITGMRSQVYNAGGNHLNYSKLEIAEKIKEFLDFTILDSEVKDNDVRHFNVSFDKIEKTGYRPQFELQYGIEELLKLFHFYEVFSYYKKI